MPKVMTRPEKNDDKEKKVKIEVKTSERRIRRGTIEAGEERRVPRQNSRRERVHKRRFNIDYEVANAVYVGAVSEKAYEFSSTEVFEMYLRSHKFRDIINSGNYVYVNGRWVLKSSQCIKVEDGVVKHCIPLEELNEYCLTMSVETVPLIPTGTSMKPGQLRVDDLKGKMYSFKDAGKIDSITKINDDNLYLFFGGGGQEPPNNFNDAVVFYMDNRGITVEELASETGLSERTIRRMRTDENNQPTLESIIAFSVGLSLSTYQSDELLYLAGYSLSPKALHRAYSLCLDMAITSSVEDCNYFLIQLGYKPLTKLYDKQKAKKLPRFFNSPFVKCVRPKHPKEK